MEAETETEAKAVEEGALGDPRYEIKLGKGTFARKVLHGLAVDILSSDLVSNMGALFERLVETWEKKRTV